MQHANYRLKEPTNIRTHMPSYARTYVHTYEKCTWNTHRYLIAVVA